MAIRKKRGGGGARRKKKTFTVPEGPIRVRLPREGQILGVVLQLSGGSRLRVACKDGNERMCRIPGRLRRHIWVREGDIVILEPWEVQSNERGDIVWRYSRLHADWLRRKGYLKDVE